MEDRIELFLDSITEDIYSELKSIYHQLGIEFNHEYEDIKKMTLKEIAELFAKIDSMPKFISVERFFSLIQGSYEAGNCSKKIKEKENNEN